MKSKDRVRRIVVPTRNWVGSTALPTAIKASRQLPRELKRHRTGAVLASCIIFSAAIMYSVLSDRQASTAPGGASLTKAQMDPGKGKPAYPTVTPDGKPIEQLGGWTRVSPPDKNPVFAYADTIGSKNINVSQQPIPDEFKPNVEEQVAYMAKGYLANEKLVIGDVTAYVGTSAKGPQSVILAKNDLLILMKSSVKISSKEWSDYINSLR